jgi:geranylgeranyl pyrophosphate synthase
MDDDDLRRGQATCHRQYNEATAILAGDGLQALAIELLGKTSLLSAQQQMERVTTLVMASGARGMVGGQFLDLQAENRNVTLEELESIHQLKTGALIRAALQMGGIAAGASKAQLSALDTYGRTIGLAFQVKDDLLDIEAPTSQLGKPQGSDMARNKSTYPSLLGIEPARNYCNTLHQQALDSLQPFGELGTELASLATFIIERNH